MTIPVWFFWVWAGLTVVTAYHAASFLATRWEYVELIAKLKSDAMYWEDVARKLRRKLGADTPRELADSIDHGLSTRLRDIAGDVKPKGD